MTTTPESETSKKLLSIKELLGLDSVSRDDKIDLLVKEAQLQFASHILTKFINEIGDATKIKQASPMELLNCIMKLLRIIKEFGDSPLMRLLNEKLAGVKEIINLEEVRADTPGEKKPDDGNLEETITGKPDPNLAIGSTNDTNMEPDF